MTPDLGTLSLTPARDSYELLAAPVADALRSVADTPGIADALVDQAFVAAIDPGNADTAVFTQEYEVPLEDSANCVLVLGKRGGELRPAGTVVLATTRVDVNHVVRRHLDVRRVSFAPQEFATEQTAMEYGGITPVGLPSTWPLLVDRRVTETAWVVVGSGLRHSKLVLRGAALAELPNAIVLDDLGR